MAPEWAVPEGQERDGGWALLEVAGPIAFSAVGVLASLAAPLAHAGVSIFAVSTHDTDYLLVKKGSLERAVTALRGADHTVFHPAESMEQEGYAVVSGQLSARECDDLAAAIALSPPERRRAGRRRLLDVPAIARIACDPRLLGLASGALSSDAFPYRATLFSKSPHANWLAVWHQDTALPLARRVDLPGWGPWSMKEGSLYAHAPAAALERIVAIRIHLDDCGAENGPLKVLPGSHSRGLLSDAEIRALVASASPVSCLAEKASLLMMRPLLVHASSKVRAPVPRRVIHVEYAPAVEICPGVEIATERASSSGFGEPSVLVEP